ncbi:ATP-binding cassette domain-containing protein [Spongiimicrobium sp. 3-5]|uniref:ATP-binding cassette domain-containing protein n=1 Tax=Spongiimicrobium sp. 3-5 TaxID=3332596 RepID=UPI0039818115
MGNRKHWGIFIDNRSDKAGFIDTLLEGRPETSYFEELSGLKGALFSKLALHRFIDEEERHDTKIITSNTPQSLKSMSSGEQKKALLRHLLQVKPDFLILDNPFDNLDVASQSNLANLLNDISQNTTIVQLISRKIDLLPFVTNLITLEGKKLVVDQITVEKGSEEETVFFEGSIPLPLHPFDYDSDVLIDLRNVSVSYGDKPILQNINWEIKPGQFWQLVGKNGSGKTTLLSMVTGENSKGYGQDLYIFDVKKGSGESIWDIKKKIGYFTPAMTDKFSGHHTVENMLISGVHDSVGLYVKPTDAEFRLAKDWLLLIGMWELRNTYFHDLSMGQQRLVMTTRAMIKHPLLLILDEPTAGLDDHSAALFVALTNKIAQESKTAIIFVSHRQEKGLTPNFIYDLHMTDKGSVGKVRN